MFRMARSDPMVDHRTKSSRWLDCAGQWQPENFSESRAIAVPSSVYSWYAGHNDIHFHDDRRGSHRHSYVQRVCGAATLGKPTATGQPSLRLVAFRPTCATEPTG